MSAAETTDFLQFNGDKQMNDMNSANTGAKLTTGDTDAGRKGRLDYDSDNPIAESKRGNMSKRRNHTG